MTNKPTPAAQPSPAPTCWLCHGEGVVSGLKCHQCDGLGEQPSPARSDKDAAREEGWDAALAAAEAAIRGRAHSDEIFVENAVDELRGLWRGGYVAESAPSSDDALDLVSKALNRAWQLGQTFWQQADSDSYKQNKKSHETEAKFDALIEETRAALARRATAGTTAAPSEPVMADGKTRLSDYLEAAAPEETAMDDWTRGYEECKRRLFKVVGAQLRATAGTEEIEAICDAYESGIGHGLQRDGYNKDALFATVECNKAYEIGYTEGERRATAGTTAAPTDVCAEMRALCSACGGTGDVVSIDGEWRGKCDCEASAWSRATAGNAAPGAICEACGGDGCVQCGGFGDLLGNAAPTEVGDEDADYHARVKAAFSAMNAAPSDVVYGYECRQPFTDPVIWCEFFSRDEPKPCKDTRNVRKYLATPAATAAPTKQKDS